MAKIAFLVALVISLTDARQHIPTHYLPLSQEIIDYVNSIKTTWKAAPSRRFEGKSIQYLKGLCGVIEDPNNEKLPGIC